MNTQNEMIYTLEKKPIIFKVYAKRIYIYELVVNI